MAKLGAFPLGGRRRATFLLGEGVKNALGVSNDISFETGINANLAAATGVDSATIPPHSAGDLIIIWAYREGGIVGPVLQAGYTALSSIPGSDSNSGTLAYKVATSSSEVTGTWTNSTGLIVTVVKGSKIGIGSVGLTLVSLSNIVTYPAISPLTNSDGTSMVLAFGGARPTTTTVEIPPVGMVNYASDIPGGTCEVGAAYTTSGVTSFPAVNGAGSGGAATAVIGVSLEITGAFVVASSFADMPLAATEGADTAAIASTLAISATLAATEGADTLAVVTTPPPLSAALAATEGTDTLAVNILQPNLTSLAATEGTDVAALVASIGGSLGATLTTSTGVNSATLPAHNTGDLLVIWAYRDGNNNTPTVPGGWTAITATGLTGSNTNSAVLAYKVAASNAEVSGTWTNATGLVAVVVSGATVGIGANSGVSYAANAVITYPAISALTNSSGSSIVIAFGGHRSVDTSVEVPPTGLTNIATDIPGGTCEVGAAYTTSGVTSFAAAAGSGSGGTSSGYAAASLEILNAASTALNATLVATEGTDTAAIAASLTTSAALATTEGADTTAISASLITSADLAVTEGTDTLSVAAVVSTTGSLASTEGTDTAAISVFVGTSISLAATEGTDTAAIAASLTTSAALATTEGTDTAAIAASLTTSADLATTEAKDTLAVAASLTTSAALATTEAKDTLAVAASLTTSAALATTEAKDTLSVAAFVGTSAALAATEGADVAAVAAIVFSPVSLAATEAEDIVAVAASLTTSAALATTEAKDTAAVVVSVTSPFTLATTEARDVIAVDVDLSNFCTKDITESADSFTAAGSIYWSVVLATTEGSDAASMALDIPYDLEMEASENEDQARARVKVKTVINNVKDFEPLLVAWEVRGDIVADEEQKLTLPGNDWSAEIPHDPARTGPPNRNRPNPGTFKPNTSDYIAPPAEIVYMLVNTGEYEDTAEIAA